MTSQTAGSISWLNVMAILAGKGRCAELAFSMSITAARLVCIRLERVTLSAACCISERNAPI